MCLRHACVIILGALALAAPGCTAPAQPTEPTMVRVAVEAPVEYERLWEAAGDVLRDYCFQLDRVDRGNGIITTMPETSSGWLELWRPQPQPAYYWWEANLHTVQRKATVSISPAEPPGAYDLCVQVDRYRFSLQERQIDNPAGALRLYSNAAPTTSGRLARVAESSHWVPLGRDGDMEQRLLAAIMKRSGLLPSAAAAGDDPTPPPSTRPQ